MTSRFFLPIHHMIPSLPPLLPTIFHHWQQETFAFLLQLFQQVRVHPLIAPSYQIATTRTLCQKANRRLSGIWQWRLDAQTTTTGTPQCQETQSISRTEWLNLSKKMMLASNHTHWLIYCQIYSLQNDATVLIPLDMPSCPHQNLTGLFFLMSRQAATKQLSTKAQSAAPQTTMTCCID